MAKFTKETYPTGVVAKKGTCPTTVARYMCVLHLCLKKIQTRGGWVCSTLVSSMSELLEREDTEYLEQRRWACRTLVSKSFANERSAAKKEHLEERDGVMFGMARNRLSLFLHRRARNMLSLSRHRLGQQWQAVSILRRVGRGSGPVGRLYRKRVSSLRILAMRFTTRIL